jgi:hypothetical protein
VNFLGERTRITAVISGDGERSEPPGKLSGIRGMVTVELPRFLERI